MYDTDDMLGSIKQVAFTYEPEGYLYCAGQTLDIAHHNAVFALLGIQFGGDGNKTFNLPDLRPTGDDGKKRDWQEGELRSIICVNGMFPVRRD